MPDYLFTAPNGKTVKVTGDSLPSEADLDAIFKDAGVAASAPEPKPDFVSHAEIPTAEELRKANTPQQRVDILKRTPVGEDLAAIADYVKLWAQKGPKAVYEGLKDIYAGNYAKGGHEAISGAGLTALPFVAAPAVSAAIANPLGMGLALGGGYLGMKGAQAGAEALGATEDQAALAGDIGGLASGVVGGRAGAAVRRLPLRQMTTTGLDAASAALENPVVGAISPRAYHVGRGLGQVADVMRQTPKPTPMSGMDALNAVGRAAAQAGVELKGADAVKLAQAVQAGANPAEVVAAIADVKPPQFAPRPARPMPVAQPVAEAAPAPVEATPEPPPAPVLLNTPIAPKVYNELAIAARRAKVTLTGADYDRLAPLVRDGMSAAEAVAPLVKPVVPEPVDPAAELAKRLGLQSDDEMFNAVAKRNVTGQWKRPPADLKARRAATSKQAVALDIPVAPPVETPAAVPPKVKPEAYEMTQTGKGKGTRYKATPEAKAAAKAAITPEVDYALNWIKQDMENIPFSKRTVIDAPPGHGSDKVGIGGSAGAPIYREIVGEEGREIVKATRDDVVKAIDNLKAGKLTKTGELVLGVAQRLSEMPMADLQKLMKTGPP